MKMLSQSFLWLKKLSSFFVMLSIALLLFICLLNILNVLFRYFFSWSYPGLPDLTEFVFILTLCSSFAPLMTQSSSVRMRLVDSLFPKKVIYFQFLGDLALMVFTFIICWQMSLYSISLFYTKQTTWVLHIPYHYIWFFSSFLLWIGFLLSVLLGLLNLTQKDLKNIT